MIVGKVVCEEIFELNSNYEEVDIKFFFYVKYVFENGEVSIVIKFFDIDVAIFVCYFCKDILVRIFIMKKEKTRNIFLEIFVIVDVAGA